MSYKKGVFKSNDMVGWKCRKFEDLSPRELYAIMQLRNEVFVIEQNCIYQDADGKDVHSFHYMGWKDDKLLAYSRILPPALSYDYPSIGRVVTHHTVRGSGLGQDLMKRSITFIVDEFGNTPIRIGAQVYLQKFYSGFGFYPSGETYLEDGIPHIEMTRPVS